MASKRKSIKPKGGSKTAHNKPAPSRANPSGKPRVKKPLKSLKSAKTGRIQETTAAGTKKIAPVTSIEETPRLLRDTKGTTAALGLLEKAIKSIYHKDLKRARIELKSLMESHPAEPEILARARTYLQICNREEASHKKPVIGNDQLYTLGVMEHNQGNYDNAINFFQQSLERNPGSDHVYYSLAASLALKGDFAQAIHYLQKAVEINEENRIYAKNDVDFVPLHGQKAFSDLIGWNQPAVSG